MKKYIQTLLLLFLLCSVKDIFASPAKQVNSWNNLSSSSTTGIFQNGTQTLTDLNQALSVNIPSSNYAPKAAYSFFHNKKLLHSFYIMTLPLWYPIMVAYIIYTLFVLSVIIGILHYAKQKHEPKMSIDKLSDMPYQQPQAAITLPQPTITEKPSALLEKASDPMLKSNIAIKKTISTNFKSEYPKAEITVLIISSNKGIPDTLKNMLSDEYTIFTAPNSEEGLSMVKQETPNLIIIDITVPNINGIILTEQIKNNKYIVHIPLIVLSDQNTTDEKIKAIESGADAYISTPFNNEYLRVLVKQLIKRQKDLKQYYTSSASAFDFSHGQLLSKEDKEYLQTATEIINDNMDNISFGPTELAAAMQTSSRNMYRKFKNLNQLPPKDFIKEQKINYAAKLLLTTTLTIQEVMYQTAFTNRSHFYRAFAKRYNQTPKEYRETNKQKDNSLSN